MRDLADAEGARHHRRREPLQGDGRADDGVGDGLEVDGVGVAELGEAQREQGRHRRGDDAAGGEPAQKQLLVAAEALAQGGREDVERADDEEHDADDDHEVEAELGEAGQVELGGQQDEEDADGELGQLELEGLHLRELNRAGDGDHEPRGDDGEEARLVHEGVGAPEAEDDQGEGEDVGVLVGDPASGEGDGDDDPGDQAERGADEEAQEERRDRGDDAVVGGAEPLEAEDRDEDADGVDHHALPVEDVVEPLGDADAAEDRRDHRRAGDDDQAPGEERQRR